MPLPAVPRTRQWPGRHVRLGDCWEIVVTSEEIGKLQAYFRRLFANEMLQVRPRPKKDDSCELYKEDEFLGVIYQDEDGDYNFSMAILDVDLD